MGEQAFELVGAQVVKRAGVLCVMVRAIAHSLAARPQAPQTERRQGASVRAGRRPNSAKCGTPSGATRLFSLTSRLAADWPDSKRHEADQVQRLSLGRLSSNGSCLAGVGGAWAAHSNCKFKTTPLHACARNRSVSANENARNSHRMTNVAHSCSSKLARSTLGAPVSQWVWANVAGLNQSNGPRAHAKLRHEGAQKSGNTRE